MFICLLEMRFVQIGLWEIQAIALSSMGLPPVFCAAWAWAFRIRLP
jgi:hypothetical protein